VIRGPLTGVEGLVARQRFRRRRQRLVLNVTLLGQAATLEIDARFIEPIEQDSSLMPQYEAPWLPDCGKTVHSHSGVSA
jgi:hypothetical protein